ncbi:SHOCT domain-containing protein [Treponema socranskii]|uniref:SHOCT domain-containing protein n=1 Tax=Treponema socranskii TaxID=53419 RepID=UPI0028E84179|nr:SHOCT domain-containing protein [Treponema socranskii]
MDYTKFEIRIKELGVKPSFLLKPVYVNLSNMISDNETINAVTSCMGKSGAGGIAVTSDNFYSVVFNKTFSADKVVIPLSKISGCAVSGLAAMKLTITEGTTKYEYNTVANSSVIVDAIKNKDSEPKNQSKPETSTSTDPAEELRKYKKLLDDGIITQEDFDQKKRMLLGF